MKIIIGVETTADQGEIDSLESCQFEWSTVISD
jgi:hypothetical protein